MQTTELLVAGAVAGAAIVYVASRRARASNSRTGGVQSQGAVKSPTALVTTAISMRAAGGITYSVAGERRDLAARSVDGTAIDAGVTVAIARIEGTMAFVTLIP